MSRRTPGTWRVSSVTDGVARRAYITAGDRQIAEVSERLSGDGSADALADAQHIVDCVNALAEVRALLRAIIRNPGNRYGVENYAEQAFALLGDE